MPEISCWSPQSDFGSPLLTGRLRVHHMVGLGQTLLSGRIHEPLGGLTAVGALGLARGLPYAVRLARDRAILVHDPSAATSLGWHAAGYAASRVDDGFAMLEIGGAGLDALLKQAVNIGSVAGSASAQVLFLGCKALCYWYEDEKRLRLHCAAPEAHFVWHWLESW